jgi:hypothetical protein
MRIAIVAPLFAPITPVGSHGNHTVIADLARGLAARGHEVSLHAPEGSCVPGVELVPVPTEPSLAEAFIDPGRREPGSVASVASRGRAVRRAFERLFADVAARRPDAISQHAFDVEAFELAEPWPTIHTLHMPPIADAAVAPLIAACGATSHPIAAVSMAGQRAWEAATRRRVTLLRNGVPDLMGCGSVDMPRRAVPAPSVAPGAIVAGRISPEKGTAEAIRLARRRRPRPARRRQRV